MGLRYEFTGSLDPVARRLLGAKRPAWIQEVRVDASAAAGTITFEAERNPKRLHGSGRFTLSPSGDSTVRRLDGELVVAVPGIGRMAKGRIVPGLLRRLGHQGSGARTADWLGRVKRRLNASFEGRHL